MAIRIQRQRTRGWRMPKNAVYVGRPSRWLALPELRGRDLACWCKISEPCHADVLLELVNEWKGERHARV
ncbi:MAG: DUF4326 domain-containing protein [Deinococcus sp.]|nr:DUF4326 domain-containing protein [Deinococcus sp.]